MLRLRLTADDLEQVRVVTRPAPMLELRSVLSGPLPAWVDRRAADPAVELVRSLVAQPCAPGFLFPSSGDLEDALDTVAGTHRDAVRRDLDDNAAAGQPLPSWTADLARPGHAGTRARQALRAGLAHAATVFVEPYARWAAPQATRTASAWRDTVAQRGVAAGLGRLGPGVRYRELELQVDLRSGAQVEARSSGAGLRVVPTLFGTPSATVSSDGQAPAMLVCPVPVGVPGRAPSPADAVADGAAEALSELIGTSRAMLLGVIAGSAGAGVRELARRTGLAPSSVSEHARVLRRTGLVEGPARGRTGLRATPLGRALIRRAAGLAREPG